MRKIGFGKLFFLSAALSLCVWVADGTRTKSDKIFTEKPPWLKVCYKEDPELGPCLREVLLSMFPQLAKGIPEVNIDPFEPLYIEKVSVSKGSGPITLAGSFINLTIVGPSNATPTFASLDLANKQMNSGIYLPLLDIKSMYNLKGKILVLPLVGHGRCELKLSRVNTKVFTDLSYPVVQGRRIMKIDRMRVTFTVGELRVNLHNLFNGNKVLGQTLNSFLNQNAGEVINELSENIADSLADILAELMNEIFGKLPMDMWLLEGKPPTDSLNNNSTSTTESEDNNGQETTTTSAEKKNDGKLEGGKDKEDDNSKKLE